MNFLLIGKPNVGKSSLYNILSSGKKNIIHQEEGTTRDWHKSLVSGYKNIFIYDTPGILIESNKENEFFFLNLLDKIDKFIYVIDYKELNFENEIQSINELRKFNKEIILVINKDDNNEKNYNLSKLGIKTFFFTSCSHKIGIDQIYEYFDKYDQKTKKNEKSFFSVAIFGKPNAGKSTLANSLIGYDRVTTSPIAGTTSDFVEDIFFYKKETFKILDTAGILKKNKIKNNSIDFKAVRNSLDIINKIDLSILLIDSQTGFDSQIKKILNMLLNKSRAVIIVLNKIDTINNKKNFIEKTKLLIKKTYSNSQNLSIIFISAINKVSVNKLKSTLCIKSRTISKKIPTSKLNDFLKKISNEKPHPLIKGKSVKFKYAVQISTHPLIIKVFSNYSKEIKKNYRTFLINKFISTFKILDTKVNLIFTTSKNPFN